jgi:hypothetical protein
MQWDSEYKRNSKVGATHWLCGWDTWTSEADDRDPLIDARTSAVEFQTREQAIACAKELGGVERRMVWEPRIRQEVFEADANGPGVGWWEPVGDYECLSDIEAEED